MLLLLLGCPTPDAPDSPAETDPVVVDDTDVATLGTTLGESGLCAATGVNAAPMPASSGGGGTSPFGTGMQTVTLGALDDPSVVVAAPAPSTVDTTLDLDAETYEIYVPPDYDGSEPYGLLVHIDASNNGGVRGPWTDILDSQKVIWIGGKQVGNSINVDIRMGKSVLGAWRMMELFNIDTTRVYGTGTSGGGRTGTMMTMLHPSLFAGGMPVCGTAWHHEVEQAYETQEPDSHYEYWGASFFPDVGGQPFADWYASFDHRFALLTSYDDFREGDIQNIYHFGMSADGVPVRLLEGPGGHCSTDGTQARDGLAWLDSPGFQLDTDDVVSGPGITLARNRTAWVTPAGLVARATVTEGGLGLWPYTAGTEVASLPSLGLRAQVEGDTLTLTLDEQTLLSATLDDVSEPIEVELHLWEFELQLRTNAHLVDPLFDQGKVLDDNRVFQLKNPPTEGWDEGAVVGVLGDYTAFAVEDATGFTCD